MSAAELRQAAETLRARASACDPWQAIDPFHHSPDVAYVSTMQPIVGLALAEWLDSAAAEFEVWGEHGRNITKPLTLAHLINGGTA